MVGAAGKQSWSVRREYKKDMKRESSESEGERWVVSVCVCVRACLPVFV